MKNLDSILRWIIMATLMSLMFVNLSCSDGDTIDEDCGCMESYSYSSIGTVSGTNLPKLGFYRSDPVPVPCQDEREWQEPTNSSSVVGGMVDYKIECN